MRKFKMGSYLLEILEEQGIKPFSKEDENAIRNLIDNEIEFEINEQGQVWSEAGIYVADVTDDELRETNKYKIQKLVDLGWEEASYIDLNDEDYCLSKEFDLFNSKSSGDYSEVIKGAEDNNIEELYITYYIYPNKQQASYITYSSNEEKATAPNEYDDYNTVLEEALEDTLFQPLHWLEIMCNEYNTTPYQIAKDSNIDRNKLYKLISNNSNINNISLSTADAIAKGLGITLIEFLEKYYPSEGGNVKINLFIDEQFEKDLYPSFIEEVKKNMHHGGYWNKVITVNNNEYLLSKAEINIVDDVDDYSITDLTGDAESFINLKLNL